MITQAAAARRADDDIRDAVRREFEWCVELDASHIIIGVTDSVVELSGEVPSLPEVHHASAAALRVRGVSAVANDISVRVPFRSARPDREIAKAIHDALFWDSVVPRDRVKVEVSDCRVILTGEVEYNFQRQEAERVASRTVGVRGVDNRIALPHNPVAGDAVQRIHEAFERNALLDADGVQVTVTGNEVILRGAVTSWAEKADAGRAAWSTPHVTAVTNLLDVRAVR
jgi:osmotically-inducible protein OsmY